MKIINEMALSRSDAIDVCLGVGKKFIDHYVKVINDQESGQPSLSHHIHEMQTWWDKVRGLKLKTTNRPLTDINLIDWFFTAGGSVEDYMDSSNAEKYNKFVHQILSDRDQPISDIITSK